VAGSIVSFRAPPVVEIVAGVALEGLGIETGPLLAAFWKEQLRDHFPQVQQQPPYSPPDEQFPAVGQAFSFNLNLAATFPAGRLWVQSNDGHELIQLQPGWFAYNWRKLQSQDEWARWKTRRNKFRDYFEALSGYLSKEGAGEPKIRQCEVTYINHIAPTRSWSQHSDFAKIFRVPQAETPYTLEQASVQAQYVLSGESGPFGRLYTKITPAFGPDGTTPLYVFELTARGAPREESIDGAIAFLDEGRRAAYHTFVSLTTDAIREDWGPGV
jgi:uncharacterized protein (TIGR04255 family)